MPAIELGRLQQQIAELSDHFQEPDRYVREVEDLLRGHALPPRRQGRIKGLRPILARLDVPPPLLKLLGQEMSAQAQQHAMEALAVADGLWTRPALETRQIAIQLLGNIPTMTAIDITSRLERWASDNREPQLVPELAGSGSKTLRANHQEMLLVFTTKLLVASDSRKQILALGILQNLVTGNHFPNLPDLFEVLRGPCSRPNRKTRPELADLLIALARRSPAETEFFLKQLLIEHANEDTRWLARQSMKVMPDDARSRLHQVLLP